MLSNPKSSRWVKNYDELAISPARKAALAIVEAGLDALHTERVISGAIHYHDSLLEVMGDAYDLKNYGRILVVGFGKVSCDAAAAVEKILADKITQGAVIGTRPGVCTRIKTYIGAHPKPTQESVAASKEMLGILTDVKEDDLVIALISGGGSSLSCWPESECSQSQRLYDAFLKTGGTIQEINVVRKHISSIKGGGLAKLLFPATVVGIIFSDVPGNHPDIVASGPTYRDSSTVEDAQAIIDKYQLGDFELNETPKEPDYFKKVFNYVVVSADTALIAMQSEAQRLGYSAEIISSELYEYPEAMVKRFTANAKLHHVTLGGGEMRLIVDRIPGVGGRSQYLSAYGLEKLAANQVFLAMDSDGIDNSRAAGGIVDQTTRTRAAELKLDVKKYLEKFDPYDFLDKTKSVIYTGQTGANVADLILLITE